MIGLLGKKVGMTQVFNEAGEQVSVTVLEVGPCRVADVKNNERDGYSAVQLAYDPIKEKRVNKPKLGKFKKAGLAPYRILKEIRTEEVEGLKAGTELKVNNFEAGDVVDIQGVSIGRGYQGVVKRHHFKGGEASHGAKFGRESGSIAQGSAYPSRVPKGRRMAGQMGNKTVTIQNIKVVKVDEEKDMMVVEGNVPGANGAFLVIRNSLKKGKDLKWKFEEEVVEEALEATSEAPEAKVEEASAEAADPKVEEVAEEKAQAGEEEAEPKEETKDAPSSGDQENKS